MSRNFLTLALLSFSISLFAQGPTLASTVVSKPTTLTMPAVGTVAKPLPPVITFRILAVSRDSFFLIQTATDAATKENPLPRSVDTPLFFRSEAQWNTFLENQRIKAKEDRDKAKALIDDAIEREESTLKIELLMKKEKLFNG